MKIFWVDEEGDLYNSEVVDGATQMDVGCECPEGCGRIHWIDSQNRQYKCSQNPVRKDWPKLTYSMVNNRPEMN